VDRVVDASGGDADDRPPLVNLSLAVNQAINAQLGIDVRAPEATIGFHVVNVLLHVVCAWLVFLLVRETWAGVEALRELLEPQHVAGAVALLWSLHPLQSEAVNYLTQRTEERRESFWEREWAHGINQGCDHPDSSLTDGAKDCSELLAPSTPTPPR
jgi:hypothetical protein